MTAQSRLHVPLLLALAAALAAPLAAADEGQVTAESGVYNGGASLKGNAVAFYLTDQPIVDPDGLPVVGDGAPPPAGDPVLAIDITAQQLEAISHERHFIVTAEDAAMQADPRYDTAAPPERVVLEKAKAALVSQQEDFQLHILPADGQDGVEFRAQSQAGRFEPEDAVAMGAGKFRSAQSTDQDVRDPASPEFWQVRIDQPLVVSEDQAGQTDITFTGDLILELQGAALQAEDHDDDVLLESGVWRDASLGTGLPLDQPAAHEQRIVLLRMVLTDAKVRIAVQGGSPSLFIAAPDLSSEQAGTGTLLGVVGTIASDDETRDLDGIQYVVPAAHTLGLTPQQGALAVAIAPTTVAAPGDGGNSFTAAAPNLLVTATAVLALVAAAGLGLARRLTSTPDLRAVEAAIEGQRYGRAARLAKRILRARPGLEDAMLGRAIALSKGGRAGSAIAEIHAHLERRDASDGSLHYVLGLAFLDVGRENEARVALAEAVRRTPALQADVVSRLGQQDSSPSMPNPIREAHGYA